MSRHRRRSAGPKSGRLVPEPARDRTPSACATRNRDSSRRPFDRRTAMSTERPGYSLTSRERAWRVTPSPLAARVRLRPRGSRHCRRTIPPGCGGLCRGISVLHQACSAAMSGGTKLRSKPATGLASRPTSLSSTSKPTHRTAACIVDRTASDHRDPRGASCALVRMDSNAVAVADGGDSSTSVTVGPIGRTSRA